MAEAGEEQGSVVASLKSLGLTKYEALVYIALLRIADATATEIHAISGVPRASVYPVLSQLQEKGLVSISPSSPRRFAALPPEEGIGSLLAKIEADAKHAQKVLTEVHRESMQAERSGQELIWNLHGIVAIRRKFLELIAQAEESIRIMAHGELFSDEIVQALARKSGEIPVEVFTHEWNKTAPPSLKVVVKCPPDLLCEFHKSKDMMAGGVCVIDNKKIFVVIGSGSEDDVALFSESDGFVRFFSRYYALIREFAGKTGQ